MKKALWRARALNAERLVAHQREIYGLGLLESLGMVQPAPATGKPRPATPLSPREVEILDSIAHGMTNKQVADHLGISEQTVKNHMSITLRKLSVNDRTQAVVCAIRAGWIEMIP